MGRPLNKRNFGSATGAAAGIIVSARKTTTARASTIVKQRGTRSFIVTNGTDGNFAARLTEGTDLAATAADSMVLYGYTNAVTDTGVALRKITARRAVDYAGNVYTWTLENDSSADYIQLTAI